MHFNLKSGIMITLCTSNPGFKVDNVMNNVIHLKSRISSLWDYYYYYDYDYDATTATSSWSSRRGWWVEGGDGGWRGGERLYLFIFSRGGGGTRNIIILCVFQCIRMSSNSFVCLRKKIETQFIRMSSNSFACLPIHWRGVPPPNQYYYFAEIKGGTPIHSYVFQFIRMSSPQKKPEPQFIRMSSNSFICIPKKPYYYYYYDYYDDYYYYY